MACSTPGAVSQYGFSIYPDVFWRALEHPEWENAPDQAYWTSLAFSETLGLEYELDFFAYVKDYEKDGIYGVYWGYTTPGRIDVFLDSPRSGFHGTSLCHELLHMYEHEILGYSYAEASENFNSDRPEDHFTAFSKPEADAIILECRNRAKSYILSGITLEPKDLPWTHSQF